MPMHVTLSDAGNPDHGQDPGRSITGLRPRRIAVADFAEASKLCRQYIGRHELGMGNWTGGVVDQDGEPIARVSFNGSVWGLPERMNDRPLWAPEQPATPPDPLDAFKWENAVVTVAGHGEIEVTGCFRRALITTVPGKFKIGDERVEFIQGIELTRDAVSTIDPFMYHPEGVWQNSELIGPEVLAAIQDALATWYAGEGAAMALRNQLLDEKRELFVLHRNLAKAEEQLAQQRVQAQAQRTKVDQLAAEIGAGPAPQP